MTRSIHWGLESWKICPWTVAKVFSKAALRPILRPTTTKSEKTNLVSLLKYEVTKVRGQALVDPFFGL
jgi:hypothetical protein